MVNKTFDLLNGGKDNKTIKKYICCTQKLGGQNIFEKRRRL
jgi:hypothetical protein